jgi:AraC-like DNA-binding protein
VAAICAMPGYAAHNIMRPQLLQVTAGSANSFSVRRDVIPHYNNQWHYHEDVELIYFKEGYGTQFIGDSIRTFMPGDIVMVGPNLPHYWRFDDRYFEEENHVKADVIVIHFRENFWGKQFLELPENMYIRTILDKAKRGLEINGKGKSQLEEYMEKILHCQDVEKIVLLLKLLMSISNCTQLNTLSSIGFKHQLKESENDRINAIYEYSLGNFKNKIQLSEIAAIAHVCPNSFCRYFKSRTQKTYMQFLMEIKVGNACKLLIENKMSIKQLCSESGFNSLSSFHKYFKKITGKSPATYKHEFIYHSKNSFMSRSLC